ncbi:APC family permease [Sediminivirga luteola]|uniref:Amino acid transporter n=1 Tax=Sediminivirga luteola TaxID=1774748 RepID=A0A8J2TVU4_9MICO|nr:APC family permease [Sediminivirga luteola]GGA04731.1 amino acid transporter [Sediminivirga luteola]
MSHQVRGTDAPAGTGGNPATGPGGISEKGLAKGTVGVLGALVIGLSVCAPAYTLTASVGPAASEVGLQTPAIFFAGFIPMFLVALGYRALNQAMPDSGTTFTWASRAFGPWIGWMGGWGLIAATVLVLSNLAGIAVEFLYLALSIATGDPAIAELADNVWINILTCLAFMAVATWICYRGMASTKTFQYITVSFQMAVLVWFIAALFIGAADPANTESLTVSPEWFNPLAVDSFSAFAAGIAVSIFVYWGWDTILTMGEETKKSKGSISTEAKAATILVVLLVVLYVTLAAACVAYAGVGEGPTGLGNPAIADNVFAALAHPVMGPGAIFLASAVLLSSVASIQSTAISPARTLLAMAHYRALPASLAAIHPKYKSPHIALLWSSVVASGFYAVMRILSEDALWDTILSLGIMVCFYYGITALSSLAYFRKTARRSLRDALAKLVLPGLGGVLLFVTFIQTTVDSMDPAFGSGASIGGLGLVFVLGVAVLLCGVAIMLVQARRRPEFFRGEVIRPGADGDEAPAEVFTA